MRKEVFVRICERNKRIRFESSNGPDDAARLRVAFHEASLTDIDLQTRLEGRVVFFQEEKVTKKGATVLCDIDEREVLDDECQLVATFSMPPVPASEECSSISRDVVDCGIVTVNEDMQSCIETCADSSAALGFVGAVVPSAEDIFDIEAEPKLSIDGVSNEPNDVIPVVTGSAKQIQKPRTSRKMQTVNVTWKDPDASLLRLRPAYDIFHRNIVRFYAEYLSSKFGLHEVNAAHYDQMGAHLCQKFPELADDSISRPQTSVCSDISQYIRNKRRREKVALMRSGLMEDNVSSSKLPRLAAEAQIPMVENEQCESDPTMTFLEAERMETVAQELASKVHMGCSTHIRFLFKASHQHRRNWISTKLPVGFPIKALIKNWPHMGQAEMILEEQGLMIQKDLDWLQTSLLKCLGELAKFSELDLPTEASHTQQVECLCQLYTKFKLRNASKDLPPCFMVREARERIASELDSVEGEGARCVLYIEGENVASCFIVADGSVRMKLPEPTPMKALVLLLASYRAWDKCFPKGYKTFLNIFEEFGVGVPVTDVNNDFKKFKKAFAMWRERQSK